MQTMLFLCNKTWLHRTELERMDVPLMRRCRFARSPHEEYYLNSSAVPHMEGCKKNPAVRGVDMRTMLWRCTWCFADLNVNKSLLAIWRAIGRVSQTNTAPCDTAEGGTERRSSVLLRASSCFTRVQ